MNTNLRTKENMNIIAEFYNDGEYTLRHGEYRRPDYIVRKKRGASEYEIFVRVYFLHGTIYAGKSHVLDIENFAIRELLNLKK